MRKALAIAALAAVVAAPFTSFAQDADATADFTLDVRLNADRKSVHSIRYGWTFDPEFSVQMRDSWDDDRDRALNAAELRNASQSVYDTMHAYSDFLLVDADGREVRMRKAGQLGASFRDRQLTVSFEAFPAQTLELKGNLEFGLFDPTFSIEFADDSKLTIEALPSSCSSKIVRPDFDEALAKNPEALADADRDPQGVKTIRLFATRLEVSCAQ